MCAESWNEKNGEVVCRQLGYGSPIEKSRCPSAKHSLSTKLVGAYNITFRCSGNEYKLSECKNETVTGTGIGCPSTQDVYVSCSEPRNYGELLSVNYQGRNSGWTSSTIART